MGVREGLLALLDRAPTHGYQLRAALEESVGSLWTVNVGQVYSTLQRLERDELVVPDGDEPDESGRLPYALTAAGREDVVAWLRAPQPRTDDVRDELVLKVLLARRTGLVDPLEVIDAQRTATMQALQGFTQRRAALADTDLERLVSLDRLALRARAELDWLDLVEERLDRAPPVPPPDEPADTTTVPTPAGSTA